MYYIRVRLLVDMDFNTNPSLEKLTHGRTPIITVSTLNDGPSRDEMPCHEKQTILSGRMLNDSFDNVLPSLAEHAGQVPPDAAEARRRNRDQRPLAHAKGCETLHVLRGLRAHR